MQQAITFASVSFACANKPRSRVTGGKGGRLSHGRVRKSIIARRCDVRHLCDTKSGADKDVEAARSGRFLKKNKNGVLSAKSRNGVTCWWVTRTQITATRFWSLGRHQERAKYTQGQKVTFYMSNQSEHTNANCISSRVHFITPDARRSESNNYPHPPPPLAFNT